MACNARRALIVFCVIQIIAIVEKQVFDFLCMLWTPILLNLIHLLLTVVVLVGICRYIYKLLVAYSVWCMLWMAWNVFVICFYYEIGALNRDLPIMKLGCERMSWLPHSFPGCPDRTPHFEDNNTTTTSIQDGLPTSSHTFPSDETTFIHRSAFPFTEIVFEEETELLFEPQSTEPPGETFNPTEDWTPTQPFTDAVDAVDYTPVGGGDDDVTASDVDSLPVASSSLRRRHDDSDEGISVAMISISYKALQAIHAVVQCILSICCFILTCSLAHIYSEEEDSFDFISGSLLPQNDEKSSTQQRYQLKALYVSTGSSR